MVKSRVNEQAGSWLAALERRTNQKPGQKVDQILDLTVTHKFPLQVVTGGKPVAGVPTDSEQCILIRIGKFMRQVYHEDRIWK